MTNLLQVEEGAVGAGDFGEEFAELAGIFNAGAGFDTAGDVNGIRTNRKDRFADIFGSEAASEQDRTNGTTRFYHFLCDRPVGDFSGAAELAGLRCVQKKARSFAES